MADQLIIRSLPEEVIRRAEAIARSKGLSREGFLRMLLIELAEYEFDIFSAGLDIARSSKSKDKK